MKIFLYLKNKQLVRNNQYLDVFFQTLVLEFDSCSQYVHYKKRLLYKNSMAKEQKILDSNE